MSKPRYSNCCYAPPLGELDSDRSGRCSACKDGAIFYTESEYDKMVNDPLAESPQTEVVIPIADFRILIGRIEEWTKNPTNRAAVVLGQISLGTLKMYDVESYKNTIKEL